METTGLVENPVGLAAGHVKIRPSEQIAPRVFIGGWPGLLHY